jgi:catechol 2,3-dioxygenase-like lactoylglutathione lyase family enzyme
VKCLGFHHVAIQARDVERVATFYREVLGLSEIERWHREDGSLRSVWLSTGGRDGFIAVEHLPDGQRVAPPALGASMVGLRIAPEARQAVKIGRAHV